MAPTKSSKTSSKGSSKPKGKTGATQSSKSRKPSADSGISKRKQKGLSLAKPGGAQKTKPAAVLKKKRRMYSEKELGIPTLNMITPAGVQKVKGQKKGKVFVDDTESMMTILAMVNADKDGQIESKMMRARQLEEIREARRKEAEARSEQKEAILEETKDSLRKKRNKKVAPKKDDVVSAPPKSKGKMKRVSFG
ncbi:hypothetical protein BU16DRAFT_530285 [Lophium mytilinum]|uniref:60S ribosomal subunit assembly/export protein LOC1 n=1 Tax=Lophium mytilinum TaxID=390894 RepID=A0A6A6QI20_9PEZI|nr:hypothetical protein BU16DRAFT_530285 [Lophium mytilinum]